MVFGIHLEILNPEFLKVNDIFLDHDAIILKVFWYKKSLI